MSNTTCIRCGAPCDKFIGGTNNPLCDDCRIHAVKGMEEGVMPLTNSQKESLLLLLDTILIDRPPKIDGDIDDLKGVMRAIDHPEKPAGELTSGVERCEK